MPRVDERLLHVLGVHHYISLTGTVYCLLIYQRVIDDFENDSLCYVGIGLSTFLFGLIATTGCKTKTSVRK